MTNVLLFSVTSCGLRQLSALFSNLLVVYHLIGRFVCMYECVYVCMYVCVQYICMLGVEVTSLVSGQVRVRVHH